MIKLLVNFVRIHTLFIIVGQLYSGYVFGADKQALLNEALKKQQALYKHIENQLADLTALEEASKQFRSSLDQNDTHLKVVEFSVTPAYHDWPKEGNNSQTQDYNIELSFLLTEHNRLLQTQYDQWLAEGWFIQRTVSEQLSAPSGTLLKVRLVR